MIAQMALVNDFDKTSVTAEMVFVSIVKPPIMLRVALKISPN